MWKVDFGNSGNCVEFLEFLELEEPNVRITGLKEEYDFNEGIHDD